MPVNLQVNKSQHIEEVKPVVGFGIIDELLVTKTLPVVVVAVVVEATSVVVLVVTSPLVETPVVVAPVVSSPVVVPVVPVVVAGRVPDVNFTKRLLLTSKDSLQSFTFSKRKLLIVPPDVPSGCL